MAGYDHRSSLSYQQEECARKTADLKRRNDQLMRVICTIDGFFRITDAQLNAMGEEVATVVKRHRKDDVTVRVQKIKAALYQASKKK